jgi:hypothetical protein
MPIALQALLVPLAILYVAGGVVAIYGVVCYYANRALRLGRRAEGAVTGEAERAPGHSLSLRVSSNPKPTKG